MTVVDSEFNGNSRGIDLRNILYANVIDTVTANNTQAGLVVRDTTTANVQGHESSGNGIGIFCNTGNFVMQDSTLCGNEAVRQDQACSSARYEVNSCEDDMICECGCDFSPVRTQSPI